MVQLAELVKYCDELLDVKAYQDYCPNGLQVEGVAEVNKIVTGVTACQALIDAAIAERADLLLVHHGFFWKGEPASLTGMRRRRIGALIENNISLLAYHLPLDAHADVGNNAQLARRLNLEVEGRFGRNDRDQVGMYGRLPKAMDAQAFAQHVAKTLSREALHLAGAGDQIERVAWCTGAAQGYIEAAADLGVQAFVSGEVSEQTTHFVRESGVHYYAAGHHATERYGVQALGQLLVKQFGITNVFIDIDNPV